MGNLKKWYFAVICFSLLCCLSSCDEPKQSTKPGDFGHLIYRPDQKNIVHWTVVGMYLNDTLIVMGNPQYVNYKYPIFNKNTGKIVDYYEIIAK